MVRGPVGGRWEARGVMGHLTGRRAPGQTPDRRAATDNSRNIPERGTNFGSHGPQAPCRGDEITARTIWVGKTARVRTRMQGLVGRGGMGSGTPSGGKESTPQTCFQPSNGTGWVNAGITEGAFGIGPPSTSPDHPRSRGDGCAGLYTPCPQPEKKNGARAGWITGMRM